MSFAPDMTPATHPSAAGKLETSGQAEAIAFVRELATAWSDANTLGVYLIGSLAHGGFSARYSDIDVALIMRDADADLVQSMLREARALSADLAPRLSLFWTDRDFVKGRFPPLDRIDYLDHAVALAERERVLPPRPSLAEVRDYLREAPFANWAKMARQFSAAAALAAADSKRYLRALLYPARFAYSWLTGGVTSNDAAVAFLSERQPVPRLDIAVMRQALACRDCGGDAGTLFPLRGVLTTHIECCEQLMASAHP